tara:strand:- start:3089 stop:3436 length:348 start_codon:yes stop_codon:yes gene_type:complete
MGNMKVKFEDDNETIKTFNDMRNDNTLEIDTDTELKRMMVDYTGSKIYEDLEEEQVEGERTVTVEDIVGVMTQEFPEFLLAITEDSWIRGYTQALYDREATNFAALMKDEKGNKK